MKLARPHPRSFFAGAGLALVAFLAMGQAASPKGPAWEYKIVDDVNSDKANELARDNWEYAGYLGEGTRGSSNDETLWRRPAK
jgi:hypothetical protein